MNIFSKYFLLIFFIAVIISPIPAQSQSHPQEQGSLYRFREFTVTLEKYPPNKNPYTSAVITLDGRGVYHRIFKRDTYEIDRTKDFKVTVPRLEYLYYNIMRSNFFEIDKSFGNPKMESGDVIRVTVRIDNQEHQVTMYDIRYLAVDMVVKTIMDVIPADYAKTFLDDYDGKDDRIEIKLD
jgi:hypothetical protein